jgi:NAD-dependent deacetylase
MSDEDLHHKITKVAHIIQDARHLVAFTGAGISTDSGIPDFRSDSSGLWKRTDIDPLEVASLFGFRQNPGAFYKWVKPLATTILDAKPNESHLALAHLEARGTLKSVITQNIDMLHTRAGNTTIFELHGHMRQTTCIRCYAIFDGVPILEQFLRDELVPHCQHCGGILKPNVILFGEQLPVRELRDAQDAAKKCDVMLIIGSSLEVAPANQLPVVAKRNHAKLIIINLEETHLDYMADVVIHARAAQILPQILAQLQDV